MTDQDNPQYKNIDNSIGYLNRKLERFREIQVIIKRLEQNDKVKSVYVDDPEDSGRVSIKVRSHQPVSEMTELVNMKISGDQITYLPEPEIYKLDISFYIDR